MTILGNDDDDGDIGEIEWGTRKQSNANDMYVHRRGILMIYKVISDCDCEGAAISEEFDQHFGT